jgi:hypothetical protein
VAEADRFKSTACIFSMNGGSPPPTAVATSAVPPANPTATAAARRRQRTRAHVRRTWTRTRTGGDGLWFLPEIISLSREILFHRERHCLRQVRQRSGGKTCDDGHTKKASQRAATIDCIHGALSF